MLADRLKVQIIYAHYLTCPNTPVLVVAPKGEVFCPKAGVDCPKGEADVVPKGLELAPNPAKPSCEIYFRISEASME